MATYEVRALLSFELERRRFAIPAPLVREVVRAVAVSALPRAPAIVEGMINLRGIVVPVLDIRHRFGLPTLPTTPQQHFIVAQAGSRIVVLPVDRVLGLVEVEESAIEPTSLPGIELVAGIARLADGLLVIHDLARFLSLDESAALEGALAAVAPHLFPQSGDGPG